MGTSLIALQERKLFCFVCPLKSGQQNYISVLVHGKLYRELVPVLAGHFAVSPTALFD